MVNFTPCDFFVNAADYKTIQEAVDAVPRFGTLYVPAGEWHTDAFELKSDMTLHLAAGARLIAPQTLDGHKPWKKARETILSHYFIGMFNLNNVTIEGEGTIENNGHCFWANFDNSPSIFDEREGIHGAFKHPVFKARPFRPVCIMAIECKHIKFRNITILNSPSYTIWALGCDHVEFDSITLNNHRRGPNTDGFDIDCCSNVRVTRCNINAGDDCIALKSDSAMLGYEKKCEHIIITENILTGLCCAVRLGYEGDGIIRDCLIADNVIHDADVGVDFLSIAPENCRFGIIHGARIERIIVNDLVMNNVRMGFKLWSGYEGEERKKDYAGYIRSISLRNMFIEAATPCFLGGEAVSDIQLENIRLHIKRPYAFDAAREAVVMPDVWGYGYLKEPLSVCNVKNIRTDNIQTTEEWLD
ncbi:MAG: right-handed parallel beta-helix repeat-containing protein [Lentisphaeria bacterium]|nr:right-handed parallel beta-helix repeat-containing protein [Lentisphaeria bacterium]